MQAGGQRALGDRAVERRRQAHVDGLDARRRQRGLPVVGRLRPELLGERGDAVVLEPAHDPHLRAVAQRGVVGGVRGRHEPRAEQRDAGHDSPCGASASREARMAAVTSSSGGQLPSNSISTEYGPS